MNSPILVVQLLAVFVLLTVAPPPAGTLRGRVEIRQVATARERRPNPAELGMSAPLRPVDRRSVVYLDPAPRAAFARLRRAGFARRPRGSGVRPKSRLR